jgi:hypothetical protein
MKNNILFTTIVFAVFCSILILTGCSRGASDRMHIVCVVDLTGSVEAEARAEAFRALQEAFGHLHRGDQLTIIPVTGDALTEGQGQILRFSLSETRAAYDSDIKKLKAEVNARLEQLQDDAKTKPYTRSDILGATAIAAEELATTPAGTKRVLVMLSDFIQEDAQRNFKRDAVTADDVSAQKLAATLAGTHRAALKNTRVYVGVLRSSDLKTLPTPRRSAVKVFWAEFLKGEGASTVTYATDGTGGLPNFMHTAG